KERKQFGKFIGEFQALQHRAAQLYIDIEITRAAVLKALQTLDASFADAGPSVAVAKARAGSTATLAVQEAVQMHGGMGMTDQVDSINATSAHYGDDGEYWIARSSRATTSVAMGAGFAVSIRLP